MADIDYSGSRGSVLLILSIGLSDGPHCAKVLGSWMIPKSTEGCFLSTGSSSASLVPICVLTVMISIYLHRKGGQRFPLSRRTPARPPAPGPFCAQNNSPQVRAKRRRIFFFSPPHSTRFVENRGSPSLSGSHPSSILFKTTPSFFLPSPSDVAAPKISGSPYK